MPDAAVPPESAPILERLPDYPLSSQCCATHLQQQVDLMLLAIEALQVGAAEQMLETAETLGLKEVVPNALVLWRLRCTNPWRRSYSRSLLTTNQAKTLVAIAHHQAKPLAVKIRKLLIEEQQMRAKQLPPAANYVLSTYLDQFRSHFSSRMNPRRARVSQYLASEAELNELALVLLNQLLFCTGTMGMQRFWISLFDGTVA